jgi:hypothetical protein
MHSLYETLQIGKILFNLSLKTIVSIGNLCTNIAGKGVHAIVSNGSFSLLLFIFLKPCT